MRLRAWAPWPLKTVLTAPSLALRVRSGVPAPAAVVGRVAPAGVRAVVGRLAALAPVLAAAVPAATLGAAPLGAARLAAAVIGPTLVGAAVPGSALVVSSLLGPPLFGARTPIWALWTRRTVRALRTLRTILPLWTVRALRALWTVRALRPRPLCAGLPLRGLGPALWPGALGLPVPPTATTTLGARRPGRTTAVRPPLVARALVDPGHWRVVHALFGAVVRPLVAAVAALAVSAVRGALAALHELSAVRPPTGAPPTTATTTIRTGEGSLLLIRSHQHSRRGPSTGPWRAGSGGPARVKGAGRPL
ncbi:MAG: hypothetical protein RL071_4068 [Pseudomonadota bacterium]